MTQHKEERGFSNNITGRLLCSIDFEWDNSVYVSVLSFLGWSNVVIEEYAQKLRNADDGNYNITSNFFLQCLYEGEDGDPDEPEKGFLKGPLLLRVSPFHPSLLYIVDNQECFRHINTYLPPLLLHPPKT